MKQTGSTILAAIVILLLTLATILFSILILLFLGLSYWLFVFKTHMLINNLWFEVPIDICMLGIIYSVMKVSREYFSKAIDQIKE